MNDDIHRMMKRVKRKELTKAAAMLFAIATIWFTILTGIAHSATNVSGVTNTYVTGDFNVGGDVYYKSAIGGLPSGSILMYTTACPSGWTRLSAYDGYYIRIATTAGQTGGSSTHSHTYSHTHNAGSIYANTGGTNHQHGGTGYLSAVSAHTHTNSGFSSCDNGGPYGFWKNNDVSGAGGGHSHYFYFGTGLTNAAHTHTISGSLLSASPAVDTDSNNPTYVAVYLCKKN